MKLAIALSTAMLAITQVAALAEYGGAPATPATDSAAAKKSSAMKGKIEKSAKKGGAAHLQKDARPAQPPSKSASPADGAGGGYY